MSFELNEGADVVSELMRRSAPKDERAAVPLTPGIDLDAASTRAAATPHHHGDVIHETTTTTHEKETIRPSGAALPATLGNVPTADPNLATLPAPSTLGNVPTAKLNPRTGKPVSMPQPLSLQPTQPSPIQTDYNNYMAPTQGAMIREEHEEVSWNLWILADS